MFAEDRTDQLLEQLVESKLLTSPDQETFVLTFPRKLVLNRFTPRVRDLFQTRLVASGQHISSSGLTTAGLTPTELGMRPLAADTPTPTPLPTPSPPTPRSANRALRLVALLLVVAALAGGWVWSHSAELVVASFPPQASVIVDGQWRGRTPLRVGEISPGQHTVRLLLDGYLTEVRDVEARPMQPVPMDFTLKESRGRLALAGVPEDAQLTVNGAVYDPKDLDDLSVLAGKSRIKVVKEGFRTFFQDVVVSAGEPAFVKVELTPIQGSVECSSIPSGAIVRVDGKEVGTTPTSLKGLAYGQHELALESPGYELYIRTLSITNETPGAIHAELRPLPPLSSPEASPIPTPSPGATPGTGATPAASATSSASATPP